MDPLSKVRVSISKPTFQPAYLLIIADFFFQLEMLLSPSENSQSSIASKNAAAAAASSSSQSTNEPPVCEHNAIICFQNVQLMVN